MSRWESVKAALRHLFLPEPWPAPEDEDTVTPAAMRQWVSGLKHPAECASGCQCDWSKEVT